MHESEIPDRNPNEQHITTPEQLIHAEMELLSIEGKLIGSDNWQEMLKLTDQDGRESGVITSTWGKRILTSSIFRGQRIASVDQKPVDCIVPPELPHGLKSLLPQVKNFAFVHSHPKPKELEHLRTTLPSDQDIQSFINLAYKVLVMVDRGGIHMITGDPLLYNESPNNLATQALAKTAQSQNTVSEAMEFLAHSLRLYGLKYFYGDLDKQGNLETIKLQLVGKGFSTK